MSTKLGGQTGGLFASARQFFLTVQPACWKVYSNALGAAKDYKLWSPRTFIVGREVRGQQFAAEDPDPIGTANRYADLVISTAAQTPGIDAWEFYNEPVINVSINGQFDLAASIEAAKKLSIAQMTFSSRLHAAGLKVVAYNLARGNPDYRLVGYLAGGAGASDYIGLHAYFAPHFEDDPVNQALRYRQIMALLPAWARKPIIFTEYGTDFNGGGFRLEANHMTPDEFVASCKAWDAALMSDKYVAGSCGFVFGADSGRWETFEMSSDDVLPQLTEAMKNSVAVGDASTGEPIPPPVDPPPTGASMITPQEISDSIAYTYSIANRWDLGEHRYGEVETKAADGNTYIINLFAGGGVVVEKGHYAPTDAKFFDRKTFAIRDTPPVVLPPPPPVTTIPPFVVPPVLPQYGMGAREGTVVAGQPFFRLSGAAIHQGVSAFCKVAVIGKNGIPVIGAHVVNKRPDGNFEDIQTDGSGTVQFNFGGGSAFTTPGTGPFTVYVATGSDFAVSLGDYQGLHTEITLQFVQVQ